MKRARAVVAGTPRLAETLAVDWKKGARLYARFGVAKEILRYEVPTVMTVTGLSDELSSTDHFADDASLR